jgi:hypothetical protein
MARRETVAAFSPSGLNRRRRVAGVTGGTGTWPGRTEVTPVPEPHEMKLIRTTESGAERWHCPQCGRSMMMRWPPGFGSRVIDEGDPTVPHRGVRGVKDGARMSRFEVDGVRLLLADEEEQWLDRVGIDWDGEAEGHTDPV